MHPREARLMFVSSPKTFVGYLCSRYTSSFPFTYNWFQTSELYLSEGDSQAANMQTSNSNLDKQNQCSAVSYRTMHSNKLWSNVAEPTDYKYLVLLDLDATVHYAVERR